MCYQLLWGLYQGDVGKATEGFKKCFKDCFKLLYKFSDMALDRGPIDSQEIWSFRTESFRGMIILQIFDLDTLGSFLNDTLRKMHQGRKRSFFFDDLTA